MRDLMENKEKKTENGKKSNLTRIYITAVLLFHISKTYLSEGVAGVIKKKTAYQ